MKSTDFSNPGVSRAPQTGASRNLAFHLSLAFCISISLVSFAGCASASKKQTPPPPNPVAMKLPKPAPMRVGADNSTRRKAPALPNIVKVPSKKDTDASATAGSDLVPPPETKTVQSTVPKFIDNEQPQDFFQGAGDVPVGETVLGSFFDSVFRPANPPNQPVSSTSYTEE